MAVSFQGAHFPHEIILPCVRWYVAYPLSTRHIEELMLERGVHVDHSTVNRWVIQYSPPREEAFHRESREMLGIMPPPASRHPQCPYPDTSA